MEEHCQYFKYYFTPYGFDKHGKPKLFTYRKKDIVRLGGLAKVDIDRPVFNMTAVEVINIILAEGHKPNPLYYTGASRVGCYPCIMSNHYEIYVMVINQPEYATRVIEAEKKVGHSFFPPDYIPARFHDCKDEKGRTWASAEKVFEYVKMRKESGKLFPQEDKNRSCMTAFNICE